MPQAKEWADEFELGIKDFGFGPDDIIRHTDIDTPTIRPFFSELFRKRIRKNLKAGRKTLLVCFYAGHGSHHPVTGMNVLMNSNHRGLAWFELEKTLHVT